MNKRRHRANSRQPILLLHAPETIIGARRHSSFRYRRRTEIGHSRVFGVRGGGQKTERSARRETARQLRSAENRCRQGSIHEIARGGNRRGSSNAPRIEKIVLEPGIEQLCAFQKERPLLIEECFKRGKVHF